MLHSETQICRIDLFQWILSASSLPDQGWQLIGQHLRICQESISSFRASLPCPLSNCVPGECSPGKVQAQRETEETAGHFISLLSFFLCEKRKSCVKKHIELPAFFPRYGYLECWFLYLVFTPFQIDCNHFRFLFYGLVWFLVFGFFWELFSWGVFLCFILLLLFCFGLGLGGLSLLRNIQCT